MLILQIHPMQSTKINYSKSKHMTNRYQTNGANP